MFLDISLFKIFNKVDYFSICDLHFSDSTQTGTFILLRGANTFGQIYANRFEHNRYGAGIAVFDSSTDICIFGNTFKDPYDIAIDIGMAGSSGVKVKRISVVGNTITKNNADIGMGIEVVNRCELITIANNTITGAAYDGITVLQSGGYTAPFMVNITGNVVNDTARHGISAIYGSNHVVSGNSISSGFPAPPSSASGWRSAPYTTR